MKEGTIGKVTANGIGSVFLELPNNSIGNGIRFNSKGDMFVADYINHNILKIEMTEKKLSVYANEPLMSQPNDIAIDSKDRFYASDPNSTSGTFATKSITIANVAAGLTPIFRDMGEVIVSANRTFRRVQALSNLPATFGVGGAPSSNAVVSDYRTYWYEVSLLDGQGAINALFQVRG